MNFGDHALLLYEDAGEEVFHERIILPHLGRGLYLILTPDGDVYEEDYSQVNRDIVPVSLMAGDRVLDDLGGSDLRQFRCPPEARRLGRLRA